MSLKWWMLLCEMIAMGLHQDTQLEYVVNRMQYIYLNIYLQICVFLLISPKIQTVYTYIDNVHTNIECKTYISSVS